MSDQTLPIRRARVGIGYGSRDYTATGFIRSHGGPFHSRCPVSRKLPRIAILNPPAGSQQSSDPSTTTLPRGQSPPRSPPSQPLQVCLGAFPRKGALFVEVLLQVVPCNTVATLECLLHFSARCLRVPTYSRGRFALATHSNCRISLDIRIK